MKRFLGVVLVFLSLGCTPSAEEFIDSLVGDYDDYEEEYPCYDDGEARLPYGTHPQELITPEGYSYSCDNVEDLQLNADGTFSLTLGGYLFSEYQDYVDDCGGSATRNATGEWTVRPSGQLCWRYNRVQPALYQCQRISYEAGEFTLWGNIDYYEGSTRIESEYEPDACTLEEE